MKALPLGKAPRGRELLRLLERGLWPVLRLPPAPGAGEDLRVIPEP